MKDRHIRIQFIDVDQLLPIRHEVLWPNKPLDYVRIDNDEEGTHFGLFVDNHLVTVISVFVDCGQAQFRKFATLEAYRGQGYGGMLFKHMLTWLAQQEVERIWCNARLEANGFYKRFGFSVSQEGVFYKGDVGYTIMEKYIAD